MNALKLHYANASLIAAALEALYNLLSDDAKVISVHRDQLLNEMLQLYDTNPDIVYHRVKVEFQGEPGDDFGGLTKDLYTSLWMQILSTYFVGESAVVPHLPLYKHAEQRHHYRAIGRILAHSIALLKTFPPRLSRCTVLCLAFGSAQVSDDMLLRDFRSVASVNFFSPFKYCNTLFIRLIYAFLTA